MSRVLLVVCLLCSSCQRMDEVRSPLQDPFPFTMKAPASEVEDLFVEMEQAIMADSFPQTTSVLVLQNDEIVYEGYFGFGDRNLLNDTRSATKSLTALAIGIAIGEGHLSVDQKVFDLMTELVPFDHDSPLKRQITVEDLLTMSSALECNDNDGNSPGNESNMYPLQYWTRWAIDIPTREIYERDDSGRGAFAYCTAGSFLLGQVLERVTGETVDQFFKRSLFDPLQIKTWQWSQSPTGEYMTGGGLRLRSRDLAKIGQMLIQDGNWAGQQVVPAEWVEKATSPLVRANSEQEYGYQFWRRAWKTECGAMPASYMSGNGGNNVVLLPELNAVVVLTRQHYGQRGMHQQSNRLLENYVLPALSC